MPFTNHENKQTPRVGDAMMKIMRNESASRVISEIFNESDSDGEFLKSENWVD